MLYAYWRKSDVIAILPTGLFDGRWQREPVAWEEIREIVLQQAIYCGVPAAHHAFHVLAPVLGGARDSGSD